MATGEASRVNYYAMDDILTDPGGLAFPEHVAVLAEYGRHLGARGGDAGGLRAG